MKFALLASGSAGNCCVLQHKESQIVIDCGTTKKYLKSCFEQIDYDHNQADALFITHTHSDHVSQMKMFDQIPTYATQKIDTHYLHHIEPFEAIDIKDFHITVLPMSHDCEGTVGYVIECGNEKMVYITDTGYIKEEVKAYIQDADYYIFESNHDIEMLMQTNRPVFIKQRIINDYGHLCNEVSANIISSVMSDKTKEIVLAHISREGNTRALALETLEAELKKKDKMHENLNCYAAQQFGIYLGGIDNKQGKQ
ncbi:MAG: MBL fold metallo-hydrolase [Longicatena sp.]